MDAVQNTEVEPEEVVPTDLKPLSDILKAKKKDESYVPKYAGLSLDEFVKELTANGLSFPELVRSTFYWDTMKKDPKAKEITDEAHKRGWNPGPVKAEKGATLGGETAEDGANVPDTRVGLNVETIPTPPPGKVINENLGAGLSINFAISSDLETFQFREGFTSIVKMNLTGRDKLPWFELTKKIGGFNGRKEFRLAFAAFVDEIVRTYDGIYRSLSSVPEPVFELHKMSNPSKAGFDIYSAIKSLPPQRYAKAIPIVRTFEKLENGKISDVDNYFGLADEVRISAELQKINLKRAREIDIFTLHDWIKNLDDEFYYLRPLPHDLDPDFQIVVAPGPFVAFNQFVDKNRFMHDILRDVINEVVRKHVILPLDQATETFVDLLERLNVRIGTFSKVSKLPSQISSAAGTEFLRSLMVASLVGRYVALYAEIDLNKMQLPTMLFCMMAKLLTPIDVWTNNFVHDCDNYIARWVLPALPGFRQSYYEFDYAKAKYREKNYLVENLTNGCFGGNEGAIYSAYLLTTDSGNGWSGAGAKSVVGVPRHSDKFLNRHDIYYRRLFGKEMMDDEDVVPQFENFSNFVNFFRTGKEIKFSASDSQLGIPFARILMMLGEKRDEIAAMAFYLDRVQRKLALMSIAYPCADRKEHSYYSTIKVDPMGPMSALLLGRFADMEVTNFSVDHIYYGWYVHEWMNEFVARYAYYKDLLIAPWFKKKDRLEQAFSTTTRNPGFMAVVRDKAMSDQIKETLEIPDVTTVRTEWFDKRKLAEQFILERTHLLGFIDHFYFTTNYKEKEDRLVKRAYEVGSRDADEKIDLDGLERIAAQRGFAELVSKARDGKIIRFDIPIHIGRKEEQDYFTQSIPVTATGDTPVSIGQIDYYHWWRDQDLFLDPNKLAFHRPPEWLLDTQPFINEDEALLPELSHQFQTFKIGYQIFKDFAFVKRY